MLRGIEFDSLFADELCDVAYTMIINDLVEMGANRSEARDVVDKRLKDQLIRSQVKQGIKPEPEPFKIDAATAAKLGIKLPTLAKDRP